MNQAFEFINKIFDKIKNKKIIAWVFIIIVLLTLILYPIIDANFLYYGRTKSRIEILGSLSNLNLNEVNNDNRTKEEYESILNDMSEQKSKSIVKIINFESNGLENLLKAITASWMFFVIALIMPFAKDKTTGKRWAKNNVLGSLLCIIIGLFIAWIATYIPIVINIWITCFFIQGIIIYLAYSISKLGNKQ